MKILSLLIIISVGSVIFYSAINSLNSILASPALEVHIALKKDENKLVVSSAGPFSRFAALANDDSSSSN